MTLVSEPRSRRSGDGYRLYGRRRRRPYLAVGIIGLLALAIAGGLVALASASASLNPDPVALARVVMPLGGGRIESVSVVTGPHSQPVPVTISGDTIWPRGKIRAGQAVSIQVELKRPGWISWLTGGRERVNLSLVAPSAAPAQSFVTLRAGAPLRVRFARPVAAVSYGPSSTQLRPLRVGAPGGEVVLPHSGSAGTLWVAGTPRTWETAPPSAVSWFPTGAVSGAVANPAPGSTITPTTPISLTFSRTVSAALGGSRPAVSPPASGSWQQVSAHTLVFHPAGYGYGLGASVRLGLPAGVRLVGAAGGGGAWHVPPGSTLRLQQLLASLGYLPLRFQSSAPVGTNPAAQEAAAIHPPAGSFSWRYGNVPAALSSMWAPGAAGEMTRGAVMAFENDHGLAPDGVAGPEVWRSLLAAAGTGRGSSFGYTFVSVNESSQRLDLWHNGRTLLTTPVNTGIASAPTAKGTFAVYEHIASGTMSGTNPDGSHYHDPGVPWISYFNGGDALHGFTRAQYGFPQSLGCVEMPPSTAGRVWPFTPIGTLVHVA